MSELHDLVIKYEVEGDEAVFAEAEPKYKAALAERPNDPELLVEYGYLLECRGMGLIRQAAVKYERAIESKPGWEKAHFRFTFARGALAEYDKAIARYKARLESAPEDVLSYRLLGRAYLIANQYEDARSVARSGLQLQPDDARLTDQLGEACAGLGRVDEALGHWSRAGRLDPTNAGPLYSTAFLLERAGRMTEAAEQWRIIIDWLNEHGYGRGPDHTEWPKRELARLEDKLAESKTASDPPVGLTD